MGQINNLKNSQMPALERRVRQSGTATPLNSAAIGREGLLVYGGGVITIENGGLKVTGTAEILGTLIASGIIQFTGEVTISGPLDVTGLMQLTGDLAVLAGGQITAGSAEINSDGSATFGLFTIAANGDLTSEGALNIKGPATLNNDLTVAAGKKITLGGLTMENTGVGGGTVNFPNGSVSSSSALGMLILSTVQIQISAPAVKLNGIASTTGVTPNVYIDGNGQLKKIT